MRQVREALEEKLIDVDASTIDYWPEDTALIQGIVVTATRRVTLLGFLTRERTRHSGERVGLSPSLIPGRDRMSRVNVVVTTGSCVPQ